MSVRLMTKGREVKNLEFYVTRSEDIRILSIALLQAFGLVWNHQDYVQKIILTKQHTNYIFSKFPPIVPKLSAIQILLAGGFFPNNILNKESLFAFSICNYCCWENTEIGKK